MWLDGNQLYIYVIYTKKWAKTLTNSGCENHYKGSQYGTDGKVSYIETIPHTVATPANRLLGWSGNYGRIVIFFSNPGTVKFHTQL